MRIQPRQQILEIWQAVAEYSYRDGRWQWGGRNGRNSISDAEQLLCILGPATSIASFALDEPDKAAEDEDTLRALRPLGGLADIPRILIGAVGEYLTTYTDEDGTPNFACASCFQVAPDADQPLSPRQRAQPVVDAFSVSLSLSLATIGFARKFRESVKQERLLAEMDDVVERAGKRLTAALVGLLRSFTVNIFDVDSPAGRALCRTVNQSGLPQRRVVALLHKSLRGVRSRLRDVTIGSGAGLADDLERPDRLFECGWSWGVVRAAPIIVTGDDVGEQPAGLAEPAPYISFTVVALDAIAALFSERTRLLGLLTEEQYRLAQGLQLRLELTQSYWSKVAVAGFGGARWPLEDVPWQHTTEKESEYFSLHVSSILVEDLVRRRAGDAELDRVGRVLEELASRARITRRGYAGDEAYRLHAPGFPIALGGSDDEGGPPLTWIMSDFAPLLLKRTISVAGLLRDPELRGRTLALADEIWSHLSRRRLRDGHRRGLWDQPSLVFPAFETAYEDPSWYYTNRVVDCLSTAADVIDRPLLLSPRLTEQARDLLAEADHLFDQELLKGSTGGGQAMLADLQELRLKLDRAWSILGERPGTAVSLAQRVLEKLERFDAARSDGAV